jgi:hypothetical protein
LTILGVLASGLVAAGCGTKTSGAFVPAADNSAGATRLAAAPDTGIAGCTALLGTHQVPAHDYPKIRAEFAGSRWPDLRQAGTAYVDLAVTVQHVRAYAYQTVWSYQRLSSTCTRHGWKNSR